MEEQQDFFNEYYEGLKTYKWVGVKDLSEQFEVSQRTIFKWLKDGKIDGIKWKNRRLCNVPSVFKFLLEKKCLEIKQIKEREIRREIEEKEFNNLSYDRGV